MSKFIRIANNLLVLKLIYRKYLLAYRFKNENIMYKN